MNSISFHFLEYPTFDDPTPTTQIYMAVGETINVPCNATGSPSPSISLKKQTTVPRRGRRSRDKRNFLILNGRYTITNAVTMDFGTYVCTATNGLGSVSKQIEIVKGGIRNDCSITNQISCCFLVKIVLYRVFVDIGTLVPGKNKNFVSNWFTLL